jgi:hypothetical protein
MDTKYSEEIYQAPTKKSQVPTQAIICYQSDMSSPRSANFPTMSRPSISTDASSVVKLTSTSRKLHFSHIPVIRNSDDLDTLPVCFLL